MELRFCRHILKTKYLETESNVDIFPISCLRQTVGYNDLQYNDSKYSF